MSAERGTSAIEALVSLALAGIALGGLAATAGLAVRSLRLARETATAVALASERLEGLRAGPRVEGGDGSVGPDGTVFSRTWRAEDGRGGAADLSVSVRWGPHAVALGSAAYP